MGTVGRRQFLIGVAGLFAAAKDVLAQRPGRQRRIGVLSGGTEKVFERSRKAFESALIRSGWESGRNLSILYRYAPGGTEPASALAELMAIQIELLMVVGGASNRFVQSTVTSVPVVTIFDSDPVADGFAKALSRPGGNMTGIAYPAGDQWDMPKQMELCREAFPTLRRLGVLSASDSSAWRAASAVAKHLGMDLIVEQATKARAIGDALNTLTKMKAEAVWVDLSPDWGWSAAEIAQWLTNARLPSISDVMEFAESGGLMAYGVGVRLAEVMQQLARYVDKILRGSKAEDLPIESPPNAKLVLNVRTARAIGYKVPSTILLRADRVIE